MAEFAYEPICPDCKTNRNVILLYNEGAYVCKECGRTVQKYVVSEGSEWRTFKSDSGSSRGADPNRVGQAERAGAELSLSLGVQNGGKALVRIQDKSSEWQKKLNDGFRDISSLGSGLDLKRVHIDRAKDAYQRIHDIKNPHNKSAVDPAVKKDFRALKREAIAGAVLYHVAKAMQVSRQRTDILREARTITDKDLRTAIKRTKLHAKVVFPDMRKWGGAMKPSHIVRRRCGELGIPMKIRNVAEKIAKATEKKGTLEGKQPATIAGASVLIALKASGDATFDEGKVALTFGLALSTLNSRAQEIKNAGINEKTADKIIEEYEAKSSRLRRRR